MTTLTSPAWEGQRRVAGSAPVRMHREFSRPDPVPPEPLSAQERRRLRGPAAAARLKEEQAYLGHVLVPTAQQARMSDLLVETFEQVGFAHPGAHELPFAVGGSGTGKTFAVRAGARRIYRALCTREELASSLPPSIKTDACEDALIPVVWVTITSTYWGSGAAINSVVKSVLQALGYQPRDRSSTDQVLQMVDRVAQHGVRLLVLDDVSNFDLDRRDAEALFRFVKFLNETLGGLGVTIASTENRPADQVAPVSLRDNEQTMVRTRTQVFEPFMIDPLGTSRTPADRAWCSYLSEWEKILAPVLPEHVPGDLADDGRLVWARATGRLVALQPFLFRLTTRAIRSGALRITSDLIEAEPPADTSFEGLHAAQGGLQ